MEKVFSVKPKKKINQMEKLLFAKPKRKGNESNGKIIFHKAKKE